MLGGHSERRFFTRHSERKRRISLKEGVILSNAKNLLKLWQYVPKWGTRKFSRGASPTFKFDITALNILKNFKKVVDNAEKVVYYTSTFQGGEGIKNLPNVLFLRVPNRRAEFPFLIRGRFF